MLKNLLTGLVLAALLLSLPNYADAQNNTNYSVLLKHQNITPEVNLESYIQNFDVNDQDLFNNRYYKLVQFSVLPTLEQRKELETQGMLLFDYIPHFAYFASFDKSFNVNMLSDYSVRSVLEIPSNAKLAYSFITNEIPVHALKGDGKVEVMISLFDDIELSELNAFLTVNNFEITKYNQAADIIHLIIPIVAVSDLADQAFVQFIEPIDAEPVPENHTGRSLHRVSALNNVNGNGEYDGTGIVVLMNDDGKIGPHIDFEGRIKANFSASFGGTHGDHVAGTILGAGNMDPLAKGMAPGAEIVVFNASGYPGYDSIYNQYYSLGIRITSTSYGNGCNAGYTSLAQTMDQQVRTLPGLMHVYSCGNSGYSDCGYGAGTGWGNITGGHKIGKNVIAVGNLDEYDNLAASSSRGPAHDGRIKPDVTAKGSSVWSTMPDNGYSYKSGTSMACPGTSGTLAVLYQAYGDLNGGLEPEAGIMKSILMNSADDLGNPGPDFQFGFGRINADKAFEVINDQNYTSATLTNGDSSIITLTVPAGLKELKLMLYWTDYEGSVSTTRALVNNLDLQLVGAGNTYLPWVLDPTPNATNLNANAIPGVDTLNNVEQITISNPVAGSYQIKVYGTHIPQGPQKFFLNWYFEDEGMKLVWPVATSKFAPGETEVIRWDAPKSTDPFSLEYSSDNGVTWNTISSNISAANRFYNWTVPALATGEVLVKLTRNMQSTTSQPFSVIGVPQQLQLDWACPDSVKLSWNSVNNANGYVVNILGNKYMDSLSYSDTNFVILHNLNAANEHYFSVHSLGPNDAIGRRSEAVYKASGVSNCPLAFDARLVNIIDPVAESYPDCGSVAQKQVKVEINNFGTNAIHGFPVSYQYGTSPVVTETYTDTITSGATKIFTFSTLFTPAQTGLNQFKVWTDLATDMLNINDTNSVIVDLYASVLDTINFTDDFESFSTCDDASNCGATVCILNNGWYNAPNYLTDDIDWRTDNGGTPTFSTGPDVDHNPGTASGNYVYLEASNGCNFKEAKLLSPCIDLTQASLPILDFWYHMNGTSMGSLSLDVYVDGEWNKNIMPTLSGNQGVVWRNKMIDLSPYVGKIITLRFRGVTGSSYYSDIALDDIKILETIGIDDREPVLGLNIYPNPSNGNFSISGIAEQNEDLRITLFDQQGKQIIDETIFVSGSFVYDLNLGDVAKGIYILQLSSSQGISREKLVVQ